jgi:hypothetical protein
MPPSGFEGGYKLLVDLIYIFTYNYYLVED